MSASPLPEVGTPITVPWSCPKWCDIDHEADGYAKHGHIVHRNSTETAAGDVGFWHSEIGTWRKKTDQVVEVHMAIGAHHFTSGRDLRSYAAELVEIAGILDEMNDGLRS